MSVSRFTTGAVVLVVLCIVAVSILLATVPIIVVQPHCQCLNNLKQIGGLLLAREAGGKLEYVEGSEFLRQVMPMVRTEDLGVFHCPEGPERVFFSYRGPDAHLLGLLKKGGQKLIIACDANGYDGEEPHHDDGTCVLWNTGRVEFIPWEKMEGYDGGPVKVGPGSPDPRFRRLVR